MQLFGTEVLSLGTTGQAQNLAKGQDGPGQPVKICDRTQDGTVQDFDSLFHTVPQDKMGQSKNYQKIWLISFKKLQKRGHLKFDFPILDFLMSKIVPN